MYIYMYKLYSLQDLESKKEKARFQLAVEVWVSD